MNVAVILNYRASLETISCAESILEYCSSIDYLVVVDNCSQDDSEDALTLWAAKCEKATVLINSENSGYAGGNNFGIQWALDNLQVDYFWIVNNDAFVRSDAFLPLFRALSSNDKQLVGSVILNSHSEALECYGGGVLYPLLGKAKLLGKGKHLSDISGIKRLPDYLMGCSLAFSTDLVDKVGMMDEEYFMYSEEVDWQYRAGKLGFSISVIPESIVFHYGSLSSGGRSEFYYYYRNRAAIRFNKRFYGIFFAFVSACFLSSITLIEEFKRPKCAFSGVRGAFKGVVMDV